MFCSWQLIHCLEKSRNKNNLRAIWGWNRQKIKNSPASRLQVEPSFPPEDVRERASRKLRWRWESPVFARFPTAILAFSTLVLDHVPEEKRGLLAVYQPLPEVTGSYIKSVYIAEWKIIPISCRHHLRGNTVDNGDVCCLPRVWMSRPVHFTAELPVWNNFERFLSRFLFWIWFISAPQLHTPTKDRVQQTALPACCFQNSTKNVLRRLNHYPLYQSSILSLHQASYNHQLLLLLLKGLALP